MGLRIYDILCYMFGKIKEELEKLNIGIVYVFGSTVQGIGKKDSDVDIAIVFTNLVEDNAMLSLYERLQVLFSDIYREKEIDIVFLQSAPLSLQLNVIKYGKAVYEVSSKFRADYEERVMLLHGDFEPISIEFDKMVLERI